MHTSRQKSKKAGRQTDRRRDKRHVYATEYVDNLSSSIDGL